MFFAAVDTPTTVGEKLALGGNTALIGMGIVFMVLIALWLIIVIEHKVIEGINKATAKPTTEKVEATTVTAEAPKATVKSGSFKGETELDGAIDDETTAVILASVSEETSIPMNEIKITDIKAL